MGQAISSKNDGFSPKRPPTQNKNICEGTNPNFPNKECVDASIKEQAGADVTKGFIGSYATTATPLTTPYWKAGLCPVNVHWHLGAEHRSSGQFDENGKGPQTTVVVSGKPPRQGHRCYYYTDKDPKFTKEYSWKHCKNMQVGETYEVHWPHSAAGACGTLHQYQTPFYDGVFCHASKITSTHQQIGVQSQTFTIVNDEAYYYPDLFRGMIVDGDKGSDIAFYTGSTTSDSRNNVVCSQYAPITWQVDRKCHLISASSMDKMCADMKSQSDDMSEDLKPKGARETVLPQYTANNMLSGSMNP